MWLRKHIPRIYLDDFFSGVVHSPEHDTQCTLNFVRYTNYDQIPNYCDIIARVYWHTRQDEILNDIDLLLPRTNRLLVFISECVTDDMLDFLRHPKVQQCEVFAEIVEDHDHQDYQTVMTWFMQNHNIYRYQDWALSLIDQLKPCIDRRPKMFDCLLGHKKPHRDWIASRLSSSTLKKSHFIYNYFKNDRTLGQWPKLPSGLNSNMGLDLVLPVDMYNDSYYSIVAETSASNRYAFFTEKTAKPIIARRPFVYFAGQHYLANLRSLGFKTFHPIIDESYDLIEDPALRWESAWQQVEALCETDPIEIHARLNSILEHNFNHFMTTDWYLPIRQSLNLIL